MLTWKKGSKWFWLISIVSVLSIALISSPALAQGGMGGGGGGMGGGGGGGMDSGVIDPPRGALFADPVPMTNLSNEQGVFEGNLEVRLASVNINGTNANLFTYNGLYPGPMINVKQGDMLKLHFRNSLPSTAEQNMLGFTKNHTNLHTHGLHVSPEEPADAAHLDIAPGETYDYMYDLSKQYPGCLNFLHNHVHGLTAEQYWGGMILPILVDDPVGMTALSGYETHTMVIKDIALSGNVPEPYTSNMDYMQGKEGNIIMVNGQVNPVLDIQPGQVQRWHILNGSNARFYKLSLEGHSFYLVGTDGGLLDRPYEMTSLLLSPGERADILVKAGPSTGYYRLLSLPYARHGNMASAQITLLTINDQGASVSDSLPGVFNPGATRMVMDTSGLPLRSLTLSMSMGRAYINGQDFDVNPYTIMSELGTYEVWEIINASGMDHPFHQHVNAAQVLSVTGGDSAYASLYTSIPAMKDVVIVPKWGSVKILVPIMDYSGMTMFHCHIVEHEDIGMMGMWHIMGPEMPMDLMVETMSLPAGEVGTVYSGNLSAMGGMTPYSWSVSSGSLPIGLTLDSITGTISGTPTTAGVADFTVMVMDSAMPMAMATQTLSITISAAPSEPLSLSTLSLPNSTVGTSYSQTLEAAGGTPPYTWAISIPALPTGLTLDPATGVINGVPMATGTFTFTAQVQDVDSNTVTRAFSIIVSPALNPLTITTSSLPSGKVGASYFQGLAATGGITPYRWSIVSGTLPGGISLNPSTGVLSGVPTKQGNYSFTVQVRESNGSLATKSFTMKVSK